MKLTTQIKATQTITPQLIGTMTILSYSAKELEDYLVELSCENPMAELVRPREPASVAEGNFVRQLRWLRQSDRQNRSYYAGEASASTPIAAPTHMTHSQTLTASRLTQ